MKRLISILATLAMVATFATAGAGAVYAGSQGVNCPTDTTRVRFYENQIGDTSDGNDDVIRCIDREDNLLTLGHTLSGLCNAPIKFQDNWNDCISSMYPIIPVGKALVLHDGDNQGGDAITLYHLDGNQRLNFVNNGFNLGNDELTSYRYITCVFGISDPRCFQQ